jgi:acylphosphatase
MVSSRSIFDDQRCRSSGHSSDRRSRSGRLVPRLTIREATRLGLDGWVRNLADGSVEAVLAGQEQSVRDMVELCREGPPLAKVMTVKEATFNGAVEPGFRQRR